MTANFKPAMTSIHHKSPTEAQGSSRQALDLSPAGVRRMWVSHGVDGIIAAMEGCEPWAVDAQPHFRDKAEESIGEVARAMNDASDAALSGGVTTSATEVIEFMGHLRSGRALALFSWLAQAHPEIPRLLVQEAQLGDADFGSILLERISALERQRLLSRVFSPERIALVLELLAEIGLESTDE